MGMKLSTDINLDDDIFAKAPGKKED